jgi:hypothetical protein
MQVVQGEVAVTAQQDDRPNNNTATNTTTLPEAEASSFNASGGQAYVENLRMDCGIILIVTVLLVASVVVTVLTVLFDVESQPDQIGASPPPPAAAAAVVPSMPPPTALSPTVSSNATSDENNWDSLLSKHVIDYINTVTLTGRTLFQAGVIYNPSWEELALLLIFSRNPLNDTWPDSPINQFRWRQRYALATALAHHQTFDNTAHECEWYGVVCANVTLPGIVGTVQAVTQLHLQWSSDPKSAVSFALSPELGLLNTLNLFYSEHVLTGSLPDMLGCLTNLVSFEVFRSALTGTLPPTIGNWTHLERFSVHDNTMVGQVPDSIGQWTRLQFLHLGDNELTGTVPAGLANLTGLIEISLWANSFEGVLSDVLGHWENMTHLDIASNKFFGTLPAWIQQWTNLQYFAVHENAGLIGPLIFGNWPKLTSLEVYECSFTGTLPAITGKSMEWMGVSFNDLTGTLSTAIGQLTNMTLFKVYSNKFGGPLPESIGQWINLERFDVGNNAFTGTIPGSVANWTRIQSAYFQLNGFVGAVPDGLCNQYNSLLSEQIVA